MRDDIRRFQMRADAAPRQIGRYDDVTTDQNGNLMNDYQTKADAAGPQIWGMDDIRTPRNPLASDMNRWSGRANAGHPAMMAADDISLGRLNGIYGRRSGSTMRSFRGKYDDGVTQRGIGYQHLLGALPDTSSSIRVLSGTEDSWFTWTNAAIAAAVGLVGYGIYKVVK